MAHSLTFDAVCEPLPGRKWRARWDRSWPAYEAWFRTRGGDAGPGVETCLAALRRHMPELVPVHAALADLCGGGDRARRFLSTWCPPAYLGGCSLAARSQDGVVRLVRNYDLSPELNEGLLLRSEWTGMPVMGMVEFLWGLSDGVNTAGLSVALAFGGRHEVCEGFGVTTILRYVLETCTDVPGALCVLGRVPSHMGYNIVLADHTGAVASVGLIRGGGMRRMRGGIATNHQHDQRSTSRAAFTRTVERRAHLEALVARQISPEELAARFLEPPLFQRDYDRGFGTLFTAEYDPCSGSLVLKWPGEDWRQSLRKFSEGSRTVDYGVADASENDLARSLEVLRPFLAAGSGAAFDAWLVAARSGTPDWTRFGALFAAQRGA
ncbi:MAG TPA: C45 family peptidase [Burkholderiales bacterium]|nr:C45 family peptidase [Burkholderiales bacterium]